ncbi:MAG: LysR family transcriptional regulator [Alphaproteobacteria bacterium]|nr:LysR family transcriptional regulator [Alphaproteobacteria bacterium]
MYKRLAWDDLRLILAVATAGTLSGAGRSLGVSHATVFRRLGAIEGRLGVKLFDRSRTGYAATLAGEEAAAAARQVESQVLEVERRIMGQDLRPSGSVRVTTLDSFLLGFLSPIFANFQSAYRDIALEIVVSNQLFSLTKREADVAIRPSLAPDETLVGRKVGTIGYAVYGRRGRVPKSGGPLDLQDVDWIGPDETMHYPEMVAWMASRELDARCRYRINSVVGMHGAVVDGHGLALLPCYLGDPDRRLVRLSETISDLATDLWLLTHPDLRKTARVRALLDFLASALKQQRGLLAGAPS